MTFNFQSVFPAKVQLYPVIYIGNSDFFAILVGRKCSRSYFKPFPIICKLYHYISIFFPACDHDFHDGAVIGRTMHDRIFSKRLEESVLE